MSTAHLKLAVAFALVALTFVLIVPYGAVVRAREAASEATPATPLPPEAKPAARAWVLTDAGSGEVLAGENASARLPMASTTKIMVGLLAFEGADLDQEVVVSGRAAAFARPIYSNVGLLPGDVLSVRELLMATLISSGDDAVYALAEHLGGGGGEAGADAFVEEMNRKARALGLRDTHFENPSGLDARGHYSSARDLAAMTRVAMEYPGFRKMVSTSRAVITTQDREIFLYNTNALLSAYPPATGVKTGTTPAAGPSLVASAAAGDESYITVVLDAREDRFSASAKALEHAFGAYDREKLVLRGERYAEAGVPYRPGETVDLVAEKDVEALVPRGSEAEREAEVVEDLPGSARPGARLGTVVVTVDGERAGESPLVAREGYERASPWERVWYTVEGFFQREQEKGTRRS